MQPSLDTLLLENALLKSHLKTDRTITCLMDTCPFCGDSHLKPLPTISSHQQVDLRNNKLEVTQYQCPFYQLRNFQRISERPGLQGVIGRGLVKELNQTSRP